MTEVNRTTAETDISAKLGSAGASRSICTGFPFLTHMLDAFACHGGFPLVISASGDTAVDPHHLIEDCGYATGRLFRNNFPYVGIVRCGNFSFPMDDALARISVDLSGRPFCSWNFSPVERTVSGMDTGVFREFFTGFSRGAGACIHVDLLRGTDAHHSVEAVFKAFGRALSSALEKSETVRTSKGVFDD